MLRFVKGTLRRLLGYSRKKEFRLRREQQSGGRAIRFSRLHERENQADEFLGGMGDGNIIMLTF